MILLTSLEAVGPKRQNTADDEWAESYVFGVKKAVVVLLLKIKR